MEEINILDWIEEIGGILLSWPAIVLFVIIFFRNAISRIIERFTDENLIKAKVGPIELERKLEVIVEKGNDAVNRLNRINDLMAKSRQLELEITIGMFQIALPEEHRRQLEEHIEEFKKLNKEHKLITNAKNS